MPVAAETKVWTLAELHSLPDDGNKYEVIRGELFVTPPPEGEHEDIGSLLAPLLDPFVARHKLGLVYRPRAVIRFEGSEVEPDLMVRARVKGLGNQWEAAPPPILVVEIQSPSTRRRDNTQKREFYKDVGVEEYWMIDGERRRVVVVRPGLPDLIATERLTWSPKGVNESLVIELSEIFD